MVRKFASRIADFKDTRPITSRCRLVYFVPQSTIAVEQITNNQHPILSVHLQCQDEVDRDVDTHREQVLQALLYSAPTHFPRPEGDKALGQSVLPSIALGN